MSDKIARHNAIREIVTARPVASQEELRRQLHKRGWDVTQSTLSRDLRELRLARIPDERGRSRYAHSDGTGDEPGPHLEAMLPQLLVGMQAVQVLVVVRTVPSGAQPVAAALDTAAWPDVLGTIAGDDTVLIICRSTRARDGVVRRLKGYLRAAS